MRLMDYSSFSMTGSGRIKNKTIAFMSRTEGSKNKPKTLLDTNNEMDSEDLFLAELIRAKAFWTSRAKELKEKGHDVERELAYAEYYKLGINQFSVIEKPNS